MKQITFVTGNAEKAVRASRLVGVPIVHRAIDLPEIQSLDLREVVADKLKRAYEIVGAPVMVEDVALEFSAFGRLPGTFVKFFEREMGLQQMCGVLDGRDRTAVARCIIGYTDGTHTEFFHGEQRGEIAPTPCPTRGHSFGWGQIFVADGFGGVTNAELNKEDYDRFFCGLRRYDLLKKFLQSLL